jgi:hypothetical protein
VSTITACKHATAPRRIDRRVALRVQAAGCRVIGQQQERNRMNRRAFPRGIRRGGGVALLAAGAGLALPGTAAAMPVAPNGFAVSTFATAPTGTPVTNNKARGAARHHHKKRSHPVVV